MPNNDKNKNLNNERQVIPYNQEVIKMQGLNQLNQLNQSQPFENQYINQQINKANNYNQMNLSEEMNVQ